MSAVEQVERILNYRFRESTHRHVEDALLHPLSDSPQRSQQVLALRSICN